MTNQPPQCAATSQQSGQRCRRVPMKGSTVCATHGGRAPQVKTAAARRLLAEKVKADASAVLGYRARDGVVLDPIEELTKVVAEMVAFKDALAARVNALTDIRYRGGAGEQLRAEVGLYRDALKETGSLLDKIARLDLEGKRQSVAERYATEIVQLLGAVFTDLVLSEQQQVRVPVVVAHHLGSVVAGRLEAAPRLVDEHPEVEGMDW